MEDVRRPKVRLVAHDGELGPDGVHGRGQHHVRRFDDSLPPRHHTGAMAQRRLRVCEVSCHAREVSYMEDPHAGLRPFRSPIKVPSREPAYVAGADGRMLAGLTPRPWVCQRGLFAHALELRLPPDSSSPRSLRHATFHPSIRTLRKPSTRATPNPLGRQRLPPRTSPGDRLASIRPEGDIRHPGWPTLRIRFSFVLAASAFYRNRAIGRPERVCSMLRKFTMTQIWRITQTGPFLSLFFWGAALAGIFSPIAGQAEPDPRTLLVFLPDTLASTVDHAPLPRNVGPCRLVAGLAVGSHISTTWRTWRGGQLRLMKADMRPYWSPRALRVPSDVSSG